MICDNERKKLTSVCQGCSLDLGLDVFPGLGLGGFGFEAEADNSGQDGCEIPDCCLLHPSTADNRVLKVGDDTKSTLLASSVALQPVSQHS